MQKSIENNLPSLFFSGRYSQNIVSLGEVHIQEHNCMSMVAYLQCSHDPKYELEIDTYYLELRKVDWRERMVLGNKDSQCLYSRGWLQPALVSFWFFCLVILVEKFWLKMKHKRLRLLIGKHYYQNSNKGKKLDCIQGQGCCLDRIYTALFPLLWMY